MIPDDPLIGLGGSVIARSCGLVLADMAKPSPHKSRCPLRTVDPGTARSVQQLRPPADRRPRSDVLNVRQPASGDRGGE